MSIVSHCGGSGEGAFTGAVSCLPMSATPTTTAEWGRVDLHTHSLHSDGVLAPAALVDLAARRKVEVLALTDHDTVAGCAEAWTACRAAGIGFVHGIELTCGWRGREIH